MKKPDHRKTVRELARYELLDADGVELVGIVAERWSPSGDRTRELEREAREQRARGAVWTNVAPPGSPRIMRWVILARHDPANPATYEGRYWRDRSGKLR